MYRELSLAEEKRAQVLSDAPPSLPSHPFAQHGAGSLLQKSVANMQPIEILEELPYAMSLKGSPVTLPYPAREELSLMRSLRRVPPHDFFKGALPLCDLSEEPPLHDPSKELPSRSLNPRHERSFLVRSLGGVPSHDPSKFPYTIPQRSSRHAPLPGTRGACCAPFTHTHPLGPALYRRPRLPRPCKPQQLQLLPAW